MKIGIITYWNSSYNYGEQLQNYALQKYLENNGHEPFLIRYDYENDIIYGSSPLYIRLIRACNPKKLAGFFKSKNDRKKLIRDSLDHPRHFDEFRKNNLRMSRIYSTINDLKNDPPPADIYITGSDQVWNTFGGKLSEKKNLLRAFYLDFGNNNTLRISYAASFGRNYISKEESEFIKPFLTKLDAVSVREKKGIDICRNLGREDTVLSPDPVLLHDACFYRNFYKNTCSEKPEGKYLFFYYLYNNDNFNIQKIFDLAKDMNLKVIYVTDDWHTTYERSFPSVNEWLKLIDNAEYVITNSYHCVLFSLIFEKRVRVINRFGEYKGMNSRIESILNLLHIEAKNIDELGFEIPVQSSDKISLSCAKNMTYPESVINKAMNRDTFQAES